MKHIWLSLLIALSFLATAVTRVRADEYPKPTGYVSDFAHVLSTDQGAALARELADFEKKTTIEIAVVTISSLNGADIETYARGLATAWGVGKKGKDNGVLFLIVPNDRRMRIETASGIRSILTDERANKIRDEIILPRFKAGNMAQGIMEGTHEIVRVLAGDSTVPRDMPSGQDDLVPLLKGFGWIVGIGLSLGLIWALTSSFLKRRAARAFVLEYREELAARLLRAKETASHEDVSKALRSRIADANDRIVSIQRLTRDDQNADWRKLEGELLSMSFRLNDQVEWMKLDISSAARTRKLAIDLLNRLPDLIEQAEKKLTEGNPSPKAKKHLEDAQAQYADAQDKHSKMATVDGAILWAILSNAQSSCLNAMHCDERSASASASKHSQSSSHSYDPGTIHDSGSSGFSGGFDGGFGGGGGFDGGGSSGGW